MTWNRSTSWLWRPTIKARHQNVGSIKRPSLVLNTSPNRPKILLITLSDRPQEQAPWNRADIAWQHGRLPGCRISLLPDSQKPRPKDFSHVRTAEQPMK